MPETTALLAGRCAIVTGAARGQGADEARALHAAGASVLLADVRDSDGRAVARSLGERAAYHHLDVRDEDDWRSAITMATGRFGPLRILINNAGVLHSETLLATSRADFEQTLATNVTGAFLGMRSAYESMAATGNASIVNICSVGGLRGRRGAGAYITSKWALRGMTKAAALEFGKYGIRVNALHPGAIRTAMLVDEDFDEDAFVERNRERLPIRRLGTGDDVAAAVVFLASDQSSYITGVDLAVDGGWTLI